MPRTYRGQYTGTNVEMSVKKINEIRPGLKICWYSVTQPGLQKFVLMRYPEKNLFSDKHIILAMLTLESKENFLFFLLLHFLSGCVALTFLTHCSLCRFHQNALHQVIQIN